MMFMRISKTIIQQTKGECYEILESNKKISPIVTELFLRGRKLNISLVFISQSYFKVPKTIRLNATHYFIMQTPNKREIQQMPSNHSSETLY